MSILSQRAGQTKRSGSYQKGDLLFSGKLAFGMIGYGGVDDYGVIVFFKYK